ncbi:MAG: DegT/DnrJ/EryC1/StrS family aminotransferase [Candidatus Omnitrophica bacterium]|nr:DegT/DnrJ/EryC1/StrS family aminotransferase [Candidatus Omnitrophota bacterium]
MSAFGKNIYVTRPTMPPLNEFVGFLKDIWERRQLTNKGKYHQELEEALKEHLGVKYISLFCNGTLALMTALEALRITGEVITTPYSFVASTHALCWNNIKPVFCDIEPDYMNIDAEKIEALITPRTTAILPVHVYGNPCNVKKIAKIAKKYELKIIYDACHAFGVKIDNKSILNYGDLSVLSFHATKVYNTFEGGAIICHDQRMKEQIDFLKNFGFANETTVIDIGINAKMNEIQAAYGLLQLKYIDKAIEKRRRIAKLYRQGLKGIKGVRFLSDIKGVRHNYSNFPIFINNDKFTRSRNEIYEALKKHHIYGRRYFYPLISQFPAYKSLPSAAIGRLPVAERITKEVLCLPIYPDLNNKDVLAIVNLVKSLLS